MSRIRESEKRYRLLYERGEELEEILKRERDIFRQYFDLVQTIIVALDREGKVTFINRKGCEVLGYPYSEIIGKNWFENFLPERIRDEVRGVFQRLVSGEVEPLESYENPVLTRDGAEKIILWHNTVLRDDSGSITGVLSLGEDVSRLRRLTHRLEFLYRGAEVLLTRELNKEERAQAAVRILVEDLGVALAWIGYAEPDGEVKILAQYPEEHPYTRDLNIRWDNTPWGQGPTGMAIRSSTPQITQDVTSDLHFTPWRDRAVQFGFASTAAFPLITRGHTVGALNLYSTQKAFFTQGLVDTLQTFTNLLASALENARLFEEIQQRLARTQALRNIDMAITGSLDPRVTINVALDEVTRQLGVDAADILKLNPHTLTLEYAAGRGFHTRVIEGMSLKLGEGLAGKAALERRIIYEPNLPGNEEFVRKELITVEGFVSYYAVPLIAKGKVLGVMEILHRSPFKGDSDWLNFLEILGGQISIAIDNAELFYNLEHSNIELVQAYDATLEGWAYALELRDRETEGHSRRVTELTVRIAREMGIKDEKIVHIRRGALLHDIGKLGIPDEILLKPGKLTEEEWEIMKKHPVYAYEMLSKIAYLRPALDIPYCHHEKWDGSGYPRGLKGEEIPLPARIFAVVDVFDALTSDRPYRKAWSREEAIAYIKERSGKDFDPAVVEVFLEVIGASRTQEAS
ncbi:HD domain-containing phosphohydrolase [Candidatus Caldatribacterium saccharofermentans]|uniref:HD domain-containing phosphohydrolase n=1 Tax=Candidatus Caldatribacterium saccharofermentans TaxID=1454753 RepID=UPI003D02712F